MLTDETELFIRTKLTEKAAQAENISLAGVEPAYFAGKEDFAAQTGVTKKEFTKEQNAAAIKNLLCDFAMTFFGRFDNTNKGAAHCPVMIVTYDILVFQEFRFGLESKTNAHNRHVAAVMQIMNKFLSGHILQSQPQIRHRRLEQIGKTVRNQATDYLPGVKGFFTNLQVKVEVS
jgi:hypothetical protein